MTTKTWFTKGLRLLEYLPFLSMPSRRQRPDLRRDCDFLLIWHLPFCRRDDKDLIYEGIATSTEYSAKYSATSVDDKDLIYEGIATHVLCHMLSPFTDDDKDLIYEGIATLRVRLYALNQICDDKDLIYEGIATKIW